MSVENEEIVFEWIPARLFENIYEPSSKKPIEWYEIAPPYISAQLLKNLFELLR